LKENGRKRASEFHLFLNLKAWASDSGRALLDTIKKSSVSQNILEIFQNLLNIFGTLKYSFYNFLETSRKFWIFLKHSQPLFNL
jgi:hypothetical protein